MIDRINTIVDELTSSEFELTSTLLKVQVLAHKLKNDKLREWADNESNGYKDKIDLPSYRILQTAVYGNLEQDRGFGGLAIRNNVQLSVAWIYNSHKIDLLKITLLNPVSALHHMLQQDQTPRINLPSSMCQLISTKYSNGYRVSSAWQIIQHHTIKEVLNSIKSNLLQFMLDIADELGEEDNIDFMKRKNVVDDLFDKNLGSGNTININTGSDSIQTTIVGENHKTNIAKGENINQEISADDIVRIKKLIDCIKVDIAKASIDSDDLVDLKNQIGSIETQLKREKPKFIILKNAFDIIKGVVSGVGANILTESTMFQLEQIGRGFGL